VRALKALRAERSQRRDRTGAVAMQIQEGRKSGSLVLEVNNISYAWGETPVIRDFSTSIMRGDKVGIVGPNGAGKTTLLKILLGDLAPQSGEVRQGTHWRWPIRTRCAPSWTRPRRRARSSVKARIIST
jgi:ATPase components of ABC transporters with duplicated ATPase domains